MGGDSLLRGEDHLAQHGVHGQLGHPATQLKSTKRIVSNTISGKIGNPSPKEALCCMEGVKLTHSHLLSLYRYIEGLYIMDFHLLRVNLEPGVQCIQTF